MNDLLHVIISFISSLNEIKSKNESTFSIMVYNKNN